MQILFVKRKILRTHYKVRSGPIVDFQVGCFPDKAKRKATRPLLFLSNTIINIIKILACNYEEDVNFIDVSTHVADFSLKLSFPDSSFEVQPSQYFGSVGCYGAMYRMVHGRERVNRDRLGPGRRRSHNLYFDSACGKLKNTKRCFIQK